MTIDDKDLKEALHASIAKQVLDGLDTSHRDELLQKAVVEVITSFTFRSAVEVVAAKLTESEQWSERVEQAIRAGFEEYLLQLQKAMPDALIAMMHGKPGSYPSYPIAGAVLRQWPLRESGTPSGGKG